MEDVFIAQALKLVKNRGCTLAIGEYCATGKNKQIEFYYTHRGFKEVGNENDTPDRRFIFDLTKEIMQQPEYFKEIKSQINGE